MGSNSLEVPPPPLNVFFLMLICNHCFDCYYNLLQQLYLQIKPILQKIGAGKVPGETEGSCKGA